MATLHVVPDTVLQLREGPPLRGFGEDCVVHILRGVPADTSDDDLLSLFVPLQY
jgi:hypothetical protein